MMRVTDAGQATGNVRDAICLRRDSVNQTFVRLRNVKYYIK
jgi:hypothetical protein